MALTKGMIYYRPIPMTDAARPAAALTLAGGWCWFDRVEVLARGQAPRLMPARDLPEPARRALCAPRPDFAGLHLDRPRLMGILNVTPDSFSDGGRYLAPEAALAQGRLMAGAGAEIIDIGGESTRPGAAEVPVDEERRRTVPVIAALRQGGIAARISIDTRKAAVAAAALAAGADIVNDVSAFGYDPAMSGVVGQAGVPVCLMHAQGTPQTMQADPHYDDVLLDVYDFLADRLAQAEAAGIPRARIMVDPGIGFGKTLDHNLTLIRGLALFHGLGCPVLLGASRKKFIGTIGGTGGATLDSDRRAPGSLALALAGVAQGAQVIRVHDVWETRQALALWRSVTGEVRS